MTPAAAANLLGLSITNEAALGNHTLEVLNIAKAHKVSSDVVASETTALGFAGTATAQGAGSDRIAVGGTAPDFSLVGSTRYGVRRDPVRLSDFRGEVVVIAFFFRARTRG